ncbi:MAG: glycosyl hydrolase family 17 protein, partial [Planctomycetota bacterium]
MILTALLLVPASLPWAERQQGATMEQGRGAEAASRVLKGACYGPFRDNEDPDRGVFPTLPELQADIAFIKKVTGVIRTYGSASSPGRIPFLCDKAGIDCYPGAWLGKESIDNKKETDALIRIAGEKRPHVKGLIVGNEVLLRGDLTEAQLIEYIRQVKRSTTLPVTTAEIWGRWRKHPALADEVDFLLIHVHPYWEGIPVDRAAQHVVDAWKQIRDGAGGKRVVIGETGWPSRGGTRGRAVAGAENQARFMEDFLRLAAREGIEYFWFDLFDEQWKSRFEGGVGAHWGIYNSDGSLKPHLKRLVPEAVREGISRPPRKVEPVVVSAPLHVYVDGASEQNGFLPSGWMGDTASIEIDRAHGVRPHSGESCIRITYDPSRSRRQGWAGIYWQFPLNNWGEYPGYMLSGAARVTFWARGERGGERAELKVGGIRSSGKPHRDSFGPISSGVIKLAQEWKKHTIDL